MIPPNLANGGAPRWPATQQAIPAASETATPPTAPIPDGATAAGMTGLIETAAAQLGIGLVRVYQWTLRPLIGSHCRFWPSCSEYAVEAITVHGAALGTVMAARRILRCNPWHAGGVDPVPGRNRHGATGTPADRKTGH